jgi:hypothetical protein
VYKIALTAIAVGFAVLGDATHHVVQAFDCSRPGAQDISICLDLTKLGPSPTLMDQLYDYGVRIVHSHRDVQQAYECMDRVISGQEPVGGVNFNNYWVSGKVQSMAPGVAVEHCRTVQTVAQYWGNTREPGPILFACNDAQLMFEIYHGRLPNQMTAYQARRCSEFITNALASGTTGGQRRPK